MRRDSWLRVRASPATRTPECRSAREHRGEILLLSERRAEQMLQQCRLGRAKFGEAKAANDEYLDPVGAAAAPLEKVSGGR